jgi:hypothetical protein
MVVCESRDVEAASRCTPFSPSSVRIPRLSVLAAVVPLTLRDIGSRNGSGHNDGPDELRCAGNGERFRDE